MRKLLAMIATFLVVVSTGIESRSSLTAQQVWKQKPVDKSASENPEAPPNEKTEGEKATEQAEQAEQAKDQAGKAGVQAEQAAEVVAPVRMWTRPVNMDRAKAARMDSIKLRKSVKKELLQFTLPALEAENDVVFFQSMIRLLDKLDTKALERVEEFGQLALGRSLKEKYVDLKLRSIEQGHVQSNEGQKLGAITFVASELVRRVQNQLDALHAHPAMQDPLTLPESWKDRDLIFWDLHVFENRMINAKRMADFGYAQAASFIKSAKRKNQEEIIRELSKIEMLPSEVQAKYQEMMEREAELRIEDMRDAVRTLQTNRDFEERLNAAFALQTDAENLQDFFAGKKPGTFERAGLNDANLTSEVTKLIADGRRAGKDVIEKAMLLRMGAHWWLRGRYGEGPQMHGLLKGPEAMNSENEMFGLYMPIKRPKTIGTYSEEEGYAPGYDRRHYYTWAVEQRAFRSSTGENGEDRQVSTTIDNVQENPGSVTQFW